LNCLLDRGFDGPSNFSQYRTDLLLTCSTCDVSYNYGASTKNVLVVTLIQDGIDSMRQAIQDKLQRTFNEHRHCKKCDQTGIYEELEISETNQFFHIQTTSPFVRTCLPL